MDVFTFREDPRPSDIEAVRRIVVSTGFFNEEEIDIAAELVEERIKRGLASGYLFLFAEQDGEVMGYTCYGPISGTRRSFDLYWIAVHESCRGRGLGKGLMAKTESLIAAQGGGRVYAETSSREQYGPTRRFYESCGYVAEAVIKDFYDVGDSKVIYVKVV